MFISSTDCLKVSKLRGATVHAPLMPTAVASLALAATCLTPHVLLAQISPETQGPQAGLEEIVVTAQKREEKLQSVPIAVTAFTASQLENLHQTSIADLTAMVPNFELSVSGSGPGASLISLRGLSFQDIEKSFEPPIGLIIDGVYLSTSTGQVAQNFDFDRIEVSAGPQGTLFGKNTTGGVINIVRSKPDPSADSVSGKAKITFGNFGEHDGEFVVLAPLVKDVLAVKLAVFSQNNSGAYRDVTLGRNVGARDYQAFSLGVDFRPTENSDVYVIYDRTNDYSQIPPQINADTPNALPLSIGGFIDGRDTPCSNPYLPGACPNGSGKAPANVTTQAAPNYASYVLNALTVNASYDFHTFKLVSVTGFRHSTEDSRNAYDVTQYNLYTGNRPETYQQFSQEVRVESEFSGPFNFVAGAYFFDSHYSIVDYSHADFAVLGNLGTADAPLYLPPGTVGAYNASGVSQASANQAAFFQGTYNFTDALRLIVGGRESWDQKHIVYDLYGGDGTLTQVGTLVPGSGAALHDTWSQFTPKAGLEYQINPDLMTYFTYSKGYNSGGFNGRAGSKFGLGPYAPEKVNSFEIGAKSEWLDHRLRANIAAFYTTFKNAQEDIIVAIPVAPYTSTTVENAANVDYKGVELQLSGKPVPEWTLSTNVGYLDARYTKFEAVLLPGPPTDNSGLKVRRTPHATIATSSDYVLPIGPGEVGLNVNATYVDAQQFDLLNDPRGEQGPVTKLNASLRYKFKMIGMDWTATAFGKNLTNATPNNTFVTGYQGSFVEFWTQDIGRTYGGSIEAKF